MILFGVGEIYSRKERCVRGCETAYIDRTYRVDEPPMTDEEVRLLLRRG